MELYRFLYKILATFLMYLFDGLQILFCVPKILWCSFLAILADDYSTADIISLCSLPLCRFTLYAATILNGRMHSLNI